MTLLTSNRKQRSDKGKPRKPKVKEQRVQALIVGGEKRREDAIEVYCKWRADGHKDLYIVVEALCALGEMTKKGWKASPYFTQVSINAQIADMLTALNDSIERLSNLDFATVGTAGIKAGISEMKETVNALGLTGASMFFDED